MSLKKIIYLTVNLFFFNFIQDKEQFWSKMIVHGKAIYKFLKLVYIRQIYFKNFYHWKWTWPCKYPLCSFITGSSCSSERHIFGCPACTVVPVKRLIFPSPCASSWDVIGIPVPSTSQCCDDKLRSVKTFLD